MSYPIWTHHAVHGGVLVRTKEELAALGEGWGDDSAVWRKHLLQDAANEVMAEEIIEPVAEVKDEKVEEIAEAKPVKKAGKKVSK